MAGTYGFTTRSIGDLRFVQVPDPPGATEWSLAVPAAEIWRVQTVRMLVTPNVGTRLGNVSYSTAAAAVAWITGATTLYAGPVAWCFAIGAPAATVLVSTNRICWPLPDVFIGPGGTLNSLSTVPSGGTLTNIYVQYQRWRV